MTEPTILITTAGGNTGFPAAMDLLGRGFSVRAFVHRPSPRAEHLAQAGADIVIGNQHDIRHLRTAFKGVQRAYLNTPLGPGALASNVAMAKAATEAGVETITAMSQWHPNPTHPAPFSRDAWLSAQVIEWAPFDVITINPGFFADNYLRLIQPAAQMGMLMAPFGAGRNAPPSSEDMGRVIAATLADPAPHVGKTYRPTGPELLDPHQIADAIASAVGRKVRYIESPEWMFKKAATALGLSAGELINVRHYMAEYRCGTYAIGAPTSVVADLTGRKPEDFETIVANYAAQTPEAQPSLGAKLKTVVLMMKIMATRAPNLDKYARKAGITPVDPPQYAQDDAHWCDTHGCSHEHGQTGAAKAKAAP